MEEKQLRRAGLDYHEFAKVTIHASLDEAINTLTPSRVSKALFTPPIRLLRPPTSSAVSATFDSEFNADFDPRYARRSYP